jgi:hypothetical protein
MVEVAADPDSGNPLRFLQGLLMSNRRYPKTTEVNKD